MKKAKDGPIITADNVTKEFGHKVAVNQLSFDVETGSIFGLIGPSGCGKTTTLRMLTGVYHPSSGSVRVLGLDPRCFTQGDRVRIGYLPQHFVLYHELTVLDNLSFVAGLFGVVGSRFNQRAREVLDFVELWDARNLPAGKLSGGMQRRLGLAAALLHEPILLFVDEPTAGIDPVLRAKFWKGFRVLRDSGCTIFLTTQYVTESEYCDRVAVLRSGKLVIVGTPADIRREALGGDALEMEAEGLGRRMLSKLRQIPGVRKVDSVAGDIAYLVVDEAETALREVRAASERLGIEVERLERRQVNFDEVFVLLMERDGTQED